MHELSITLSLIELATRAADAAAEARAIRAVRIRVGEMAGVEAEALRFAWSVASEGTRCQGAALVIETVPARFRCGHCGLEMAPGPAPRRLACHACGASAPTLVAGRELDLVALEIDDSSGENPPAAAERPQPQEPHDAPNP